MGVTKRYYLNFGLLSVIYYILLTVYSGGCSFTEFLSLSGSPMSPFPVGHTPPPQYCNNSKRWKKKNWNYSLEIRTKYLVRKKIYTIRSYVCYPFHLVIMLLMGMGIFPRYSCVYIYNSNSPPLSLFFFFFCICDIYLFVIFKKRLDSEVSEKIWKTFDSPSSQVCLEYICLDSKCSENG